MVVMRESEKWAFEMTVSFFYIERKQKQNRRIRLILWAKCETAQSIRPTVAGAILESYA